MTDNNGVVVHVDHARIGGDPLGDLVHTLHGRQAGADVEKLADARVRAEPHDPAQELAVLASEPAQLWDRLGRPFGCLPVDREVVLAARVLP